MNDGQVLADLVQPARPPRPPRRARSRTRVLRDRQPLGPLGLPALERREVDVLRGPRRSGAAARPRRAARFSTRSVVAIVRSAISRLMRSRAWRVSAWMAACAWAMPRSRSALMSSCSLRRCSSAEWRARSRISVASCRAAASCWRYSSASFSDSARAVSAASMLFWIAARRSSRSPAMRPKRELLEDEQHDQERDQGPEAEPQVGLDQTAVVRLPPPRPGTAGTAGARASRQAMKNATKDMSSA